MSKPGGKLKREETKDSSVLQYEDAALKTTIHFFAEELLPYFGIDGNVIGFAPTELVYLDLKKLFQDFNLVMEDGSWKHFEFQSTNEGVAGLKRFRTYEAMTSYQYKVAVTTYVLFSGNIKKPMTQFTEGINTYRVYPIVLQDKNADQVIAELQNRIGHGESLTRKELVPLTLCTLMSGEMEQKERVKAAFIITRTATSVDPEDIRKIEAVIYTMAEKFLDSIGMEEVLEEIRMSRLGQMLFDKGMEANKVENAKNLLDVLETDVIAQRIGLPLEVVLQLKEETVSKKSNSSADAD